MTALQPTCGECKQSLLPDLIVSQACHHTHCRKCLVSWLQDNKVCCACKLPIANTQTVTQCFQALIPDLQTIFEALPTKDLAAIINDPENFEQQCVICFEQPVPPLCYDRASNDFVHPLCALERSARSLHVMSWEDLIDTSHLPQYQPSTPKAAPSLKKSKRSSPKTSYLKPLLILVTVISFCAFIASLFSFGRGNLFLFVLGFPFYVLSKLLYLAAAGLKQALNLSQ